MAESSPELPPKACCMPAAEGAPIGLNISARSGVRGAAAVVRVASGDTGGMVRLEGGAFLMGSESPLVFAGDGEGPVREVRVDPFWMDTTAVTNEQFTRFIRETGYATEAQRFGWSFVFVGHLSAKYAAKLRRVVETPWWVNVPLASWEKPEGDRSNIRDRMDHPVTHVSWNDAAAFAAWAGKRLPTEAEWEYASRGGLEQKTYPWGDELTPMGRHRCNIWQGKFPEINTAEDGHRGTSPVTAYEPNAFGIYNTCGNVWEWVADWFSTSFHAVAEDATRRNPAGPAVGDRRVMKGGSFMCHKSYCNRYRCAARTNNTPDSSTSHLGFRCVRDVR